MKKLGIILLIIIFVAAVWISLVFLTASLKALGIVIVAIGLAVIAIAITYLIRGKKPDEPDNRET